MLRFVGGHPHILHQPEASLLLGTPGHEPLEGWALQVFIFGPGPIRLVIWPPLISLGQQMGLFYMVSPQSCFWMMIGQSLPQGLNWKGLGDWSHLLAGSLWCDAAWGTLVHQSTVWDLLHW